MNFRFTESAARALQIAERESKNLKHFYIGSEHLLLGLLQEPSGVAGAILRSEGLNTEDIYRLIDDLTINGAGAPVKEREGYTPRTILIFEEAKNAAAEYHSELIATEHLLLGILREGRNCAVQILLSLKKNPGEIYLKTLLAMGEDIEKAKESLRRKSKRRGSFLAKYSRDLTAMAREQKLDPVIGRDTEIERVIQILSRRTKNNPCLVGDPGVGKTAIVEGLALKIAEGNVPDTVRDKRVLKLDLSGMVAGTKYRGEFEERMKNLITEASEDKSVILFLDEIHTLIGAGGAEGSMDAANILKPALSRGELQLIGATTLAEYRKHIEKDAALERRFQPIDVAEPTEEEAIRILKGIAPCYEEHHRVKYTDEALEAAVRLSARYINDRNLPDKAIDLIDEAGSGVRLKKLEKADETEKLKEEIMKVDLMVARLVKIGANDKAEELAKKEKQLQSKLAKLNLKKLKDTSSDICEVTAEHIADACATWTKVPVKKLTEKESDRLLKLEDILHKRVIGQDDAVTKISKAMRRQRVGLSDPNRPIGTFLFLGPTGVGKTELTKALAEAMFGSESSLIRVDMSEYMESNSVAKMIGSPPGYVGFEDGGQLSDKVRRNPYSVVLFDEIEKAHPDVFNILLQVLDEGHITDSKGRKVSFKNTIIIMTSNAGASRIVEPKNLGFYAKSDEKKDYDSMRSNVMDEVKKLFKPEFINRIDDIIVFRALNKKDMTDICTLITKKLSERCKAQMNIKLTVTPALKAYIVDKYADTKMGARPIKRAVLTEIEDKLSEEILRKEIVPGDIVSASRRNGETVFIKKNKPESSKQ